jgi:hypothetical protein
MSFAGLTKADRKFLGGLQKKRNALKAKGKKGKETPDKSEGKKKEKKEKKYDKATVAKELGGALTKAGAKISKAQDASRTSVQALRDKNRAARSKKSKSYRF